MEMDANTVFVCACVCVYKDNPTSNVFHKGLRKYYTVSSRQDIPETQGVCVFVLIKAFSTLTQSSSFSFCTPGSGKNYVGIPVC